MVFVALILGSGYVLNAAGDTDNPFDQIAFLSSWANGGESRFVQDFAVNSDSSGVTLPASGTGDTGIDLTGLSTSASQFQLPSVSQLTSTDSNTATIPGADTLAPPDQGDQNSIAWSDVGDVFYDLWFICATTAVFIVIQQVFKFTVKQFKRRLPRMAAAK